jgi:rare lipoprotein A
VVAKGDDSLHDFAWRVKIMRKIQMLSFALFAAPCLLAFSGDSHLGTGPASYYGREFMGSRTASGEKFDPGAMTAAHKTIAFGTRIRVTNLANDKAVIVRVNDRGPWKKDRIIDISYAAAKQIGMHRSGTARVRLDRVTN